MLRLKTHGKIGTVSRPVQPLENNVRLDFAPRLESSEASRGTGTGSACLREANDMRSP